jgi:predicted ATP-grasp superfamily ATP-dependent carboligase
MSAGDTLLIVGASARAAAFSALRAGLTPWCVDLFADADLRAVCPAHRLEGKYPHGFDAWFDRAPPGPWMYTGGLENWPDLVERWTSKRPLWGNGAKVLSGPARDPVKRYRLICSGGFRTPQIRTRSGPLPTAGRWLVKPRRGSGGLDIRRWDGSRIDLQHYLQQYLRCSSASAVYVGDGNRACLLGATEQLVGETWLHAAPFQYCGSIGPLPLSKNLRLVLETLGDWLARGCGLCGLFGVDGVFHRGCFTVIEINPRYPASVEVLERAGEFASLRWHQAVFERKELLGPPQVSSGPVVGKAVLFARRQLRFPDSGRWQKSTFADLPAPGELIVERKPILTFFAKGASIDACREALQRAAADLDRMLFPA